MDDDLKDAKDEHDIDVARDEESERRVAEAVAGYEARQLKAEKMRQDNNIKVTAEYRLKPRKRL